MGTSMLRHQSRMGHQLGGSGPASPLSQPAWPSTPAWQAGGLAPIGAHVAFGARGELSRVCARVDLSVDRFPIAPVFKLGLENVPN